MRYPTHRWTPSRRMLLRGALNGTAVALGVPLFDVFLNGNGTALASGCTLPKRFGLFFWGNGTLPDRWIPPDEGVGYTLSDELAPLAPVKDVVTVVTGMACKVDNWIPHSSGAAGILSAAPLREDETFSAPSIDQVVASYLGGQTLYPSLQTSCVPMTGLSYAGPNNVYPPESDPWTLFDRLFGPSFREPGSEAVLDPRLALRQSVLDAVMGDVERLQTRLGVDDRARLDQHLTGLREIELRLAKAQEDPPNLEACVRPTEPQTSYPDVDGRPPLSERNRVMAELLAMALACDQTRVFAHYFSHPVNDLLFPSASAGHHDLTHNEPGDQPQVHDITVQIIEEYAAFLDIFRGLSEGGETLLDHCVVMGTSEVSLGRTHSIEEMPILLGGSACGALKMGLHHRSYSKDNATKVLISLLHALDILVPELGQGDGLATEGLSEIEA